MTHVSFERKCAADDRPTNIDQMRAKVIAGITANIENVPHKGNKNRDWQSDFVKICIPFICTIQNGL